MTRSTALLILAMVVSLAQGVAAQAQDAPRNDLPQPYRTTRDWGELPPGVKWAAVTAIEPAPDGTIYVIHRCFANSCAGRSEAPILKYDASGKLLKSWGEGMFIFPHGATVDRDGNLWVTDARGERRQGPPGVQVQPGRQGADDARPGGRQRLRPAICSISRPTSSSRRTATSSSPTATATARTTAS